MGILMSTAAIFGASPPDVTPMYYYLGLAVLAVAMIWGLVMAYQSWQEAHEELDPASPDELLDAFRQARSEGELDEEEFAKIQKQLRP